MMNLVNVTRYCVSRFVKDERGQGMVEYGLIIAAIAIIVLAALTPFGGAIAARFTAFMASFNAA